MKSDDIDVVLQRVQCIRSLICMICDDNNPKPSLNAIYSDLHRLENQLLAAWVEAIHQERWSA